MMSPVSRIAGLGLGGGGDRILILSSGSLRLKVINSLRETPSFRLQIEERLSLAKGNLGCFLEIVAFELVLKQADI